MSLARPTERQLDTFCEAIMDGKSNTAAFHAAYPESVTTKASARTLAYNITQLVNFPLRLQQLLEVDAATRASNTYAMRGSRIGLLAEIARKATDEGRYADAISALRELNKMQDSNEEVQNNRVKDAGNGDVPQVILSHNTTLLPGRG